MIIGTLNKRISIYGPVDVTDGQGGRKRTWEKIMETWANIAVPKTAQASIQGAVASELTYEVTIRENSTNLVGCQVRNNDNTYEVVHGFTTPFHATKLECRIVKRRV